LRNLLCALELRELQLQLLVLRVERRVVRDRLSPVLPPRTSLAKREQQHDADEDDEQHNADRPAVTEP